MSLNLFYKPLTKRSLFYLREEVPTTIFFMPKYKGMKGWRLPTIDEFNAIRESRIQKGGINIHFYDSTYVWIDSDLRCATSKKRALLLLVKDKVNL